MSGGGGSTRIWANAKHPNQGPESTYRILGGAASHFSEWRQRGNGDSSGLACSGGGAPPEGHCDHSPQAHPLLPAAALGGPTSWAAIAVPEDVMRLGRVVPGGADWLDVPQPLRGHADGCGSRRLRRWGGTRLQPRAGPEAGGRRRERAVEYRDERLRAGHEGRPRRQGRAQEPDAQPDRAHAAARGEQKQGGGCLRKCTQYPSQCLIYCGIIAG